MNFVVTFDWKFFVTLGTTVCGLVLFAKMSPEAAERVSIHAIDACQEIMVAGNSNQ